MNATNIFSFVTCWKGKHNLETPMDLQIAQLSNVVGIQFRFTTSLSGWGKGNGILFTSLYGCHSQVVRLPMFWLRCTSKFNISMSILFFSRYAHVLRTLSGAVHKLCGAALFHRFHARPVASHAMLYMECVLSQYSNLVALMICA